MAAAKGEMNDVALSFAGEQREYVRAVANHLKGAGVTVYFDEFDTEAWGRDLAVHFDNVFRKQSRFVVPFLSKEYATKGWTRHEFGSALARALEVEDRYILPVRFDDTDIPGLRPTIRFEDAREQEPKEIAEKILAVLGKAEPAAGAKPVAKATRVPKVPPTDFNPYAEAEETVTYLRRDLAQRARELESRGYGVHAQDRDGRFMLRLMRSGQTIYSLDVWIGGGISENTIHFSTGYGGYVSPGSYNAWGAMEWDRKRDVPVVKLYNMSLLPETGKDAMLTRGELADAIWDAICEHLENAAG